MLSSKTKNRESRELVTVVIPTFNRRRMLLRCIKSVLGSSYRPIEIIVADDASTDGTKESMVGLSESNKSIRYFRNAKTLLLSATINRALEMASGKYIFILDDDNVIDRNCISELVSGFSLDKQIGIVGPLALYYSKKDIIMHAGTLHSRFMRRAIYPNMNEKWVNQIKKGEAREDFANAFMFKRSLLKEVGGWDLLVPFMGEDGDFEARVRRAGYKVIINPKAKTYHDIPYEPQNKYFMRLNETRLYHVMHSKILYEARYDSNLGKITFTLSIPLYFGFYLARILTSENGPIRKLSLIQALLSGILSGIADVLLGKSQIQRFDTNE